MRFLLPILLLTTGFVTATEARPLPVNARHNTRLTPSENTPDPADEPLVIRLLGQARQHLSRRYRAGGTGATGFDCSGFTRACFGKIGINLPHSSAAQGTMGQAVQKHEAQVGDLIFFNGHRAGGSRIGHVGLIVNVVGQQIKFIHSAWNGGVRYDYLHADYYARRFRGIRRVLR